jgi:hypothetical protein
LDRHPLVGLYRARRRRADISRTEARCPCREVRKRHAGAAVRRIADEDIAVPTPDDES